MARIRHTLGPLIAFHGCDRSVGEAVLAGTKPLQPSSNDYDWLGPGVYFWVDSVERGLHWATELTTRPESEVKHPFVVGALIHPSLCLNLTDPGAMRELLDAYAYVARMSAARGWELPRNSARASDVFLCRRLDCAVINALHQLRAEYGIPPYDTVYGVFEEGEELYPGSGFRQKTHVQIAVRNSECIVGCFRAQGQ